MADRATRALRVLLVEDDDADVALMLEALEEMSAPFVVDVASDGDVALETLAGHGLDGRPRIDLVLLDLNLPRLSGRDVLSALKADERLALLPVFVMSTSRARDDIEDSYRSGATAYLAKPVEYEDFVAVIRQLVQFLEYVHLPG